MAICNAIKNNRRLRFLYDGYARVVEPHTYGVDTKGHKALRAYQVSGGSDSGEHSGWKLFHAQDMHGVQTLEDGFLNPRPGYKREDSAFSRIECQL